jgi:transposase
MPAASRFSPEERGKIIAYRDSGLSYRQISAKVGRCASSICTFLKNPGAYGKQKTSGRPSKVSPRDKHRIIKTASNSTKTCAQIKAECDLQVSKETIRRVLKKSLVIVSAKMKPAPHLKPIHKQRRLDFARENMATEWNKVNFYFFYFYFTLGHLFG